MAGGTPGFKRVSERGEVNPLSISTDRKRFTAGEVDQQWLEQQKPSEIRHQYNSGKNKDLDAAISLY